MTECQTGHQQRLDANTLQARLESIVDMVLSVRRSVREPACELARYPLEQQERFLAAAEYISQETVELAYNFCVFGLASLRHFDAEEWPQWVRHILATYDQGGVLAAIVSMQKVEEYAQGLRAARCDVRLERIAPLLERFITGLNGRPLRLAECEHAYTDTQTLFLPAVVGQFGAEEENFRLYKAMAVHQWAQTRFGTWRVGVTAAIARFDQPEHALRVFHGLETLRLDACIARELPGVSREMRQLRAAQGEQALPAAWRQAAEQLARTDARVQDSHAWLARLHAHSELPDAVCYQGRLFPERTEAAIAHRLQEDKHALQTRLALLRAEHGLAARRPPVAEDPPFQVVKTPAPDMPEGFRFQLQLHGEPLPPIADVQSRLDSITVDLGHVPAEYLVPAGSGAYRAAVGDGGAAASDTSTQTGYRYDEWDHVRQQYRPSWCLLAERDVHPVADDFVARTLHKHRGLLKHLYRTFEALRGEDRRLRKEPFGDAIDLDALIDSYADQRAGLEGDERVFTKRKRVERDIAVIFLVDMSGSTKGWINEVEREALVLLCEALEILGDRYAIYGFSGVTHKRCELYRVKRLDESYGEEVRARISGMRPQDYTRMGVFIRHAAGLFAEIEARTKLLITISDGRPDDQDGYRGSYGIEDTRQALLEARYQGIHPYCITIDEQAMEYLPHMYGAAAFSVINEVHRLPYRVSDIYRRITH